MLILKKAARVSAVKKTLLGQSNKQRCTDYFFKTLTFIRQGASHGRHRGDGRFKGEPRGAGGHRRKLTIGWNEKESSHVWNGHLVSHSYHRRLQKKMPPSPPTPPPAVPWAQTSTVAPPVDPRSLSRSSASYQMGLSGHCSSVNAVSQHPATPCAELSTPRRPCCGSRPQRHRCLLSFPMRGKAAFAQPATTHDNLLDHLCRFWRQTEPWLWAACGIIT